MRRLRRLGLRQNLDSRDWLLEASHLVSGAVVLELTIYADSYGDHGLYAQVTGSQLMMTFPPSRCPKSRISSRFSIITALVSATAISAGYLPNTSFSLLYLYEATPKRTVTLGSSSNLSRSNGLPMCSSIYAVFPYQGETESFSSIPCLFKWHPFQEEIVPICTHMV